MSSIPGPRFVKRKVFILRLWARGKDEQVWVGEVQDVSTGETIHIQSLEALFDWLKQKTEQTIQPSKEKNDLLESTQDARPANGKMSDS